MNEIYLKNMENLKKTDEGVFAIIEASDAAPLKHEIFTTNTGDATLQITIQGYNNLQEQSFFLHSKYDPYKAEASFVNKSYENKKCIILYGFGFGYHIELFLEKLAGDQRLYVLEANIPIVKLAFMTRDLSHIINNHRVKLILLSDKSNLSGVGHLFMQQKDATLSIHQASLKAIPSEYSAFANVLNDLRMMQWGIEKNNELLIENYLNNSKLKLNNISSLFGKADSFPVVIVSAGPSLNINKHKLHRMKEKALIFSVGSALKTLIREGIDPDLFCIIDPQPLTYKQIEGYENIDIPLVFLDTASHFTVSQYNGPKFIAGNSKERLKNNEEAIETGGSVATAVLDIAIRLGGNPIIFVGQDLAFTEYEHHAEGSMYGEEKMIKDLPNLKKVMGHNGEIYPTSSSLLSFKNWIERKIEEHPEILFINASEKGAFIKGCQHLELETATNNIFFDEKSNLCKFLEILKSSSLNTLF